MIIRSIKARAAGQHVRARAAVEHIVARSAGQRIDARPAGQHVVARAAIDAGTAVTSGQHVVMRRADQIFDSGQRVAGRIAAIGKAGLQVDDDTVGRIGETGGIDPGAAIQRVGARARDQHVVTGATAQRAAARRGTQRIAIGRPDDVFDIVETVTLGVAELSEAGGEVDRHTRRARRIIGGVVTGAAIERIRPSAAGQQVVARAAGQDVGVGVAGQHVVTGAAGQIFDTRQRIALCIAAMAETIDQADANRLGGSGIVRGVETGSADQLVGASATGQNIVALAALQRVGTSAAQQRVVATAAVERVVALIADQRIGTRAAFDLVGTGGAGDAVVVRRTDDMFDRQQPVALGVAAVADTAVHRDFDPSRRIGIGHGVETSTAVHRIGTAAPGQQIVARATDQRFVRAAAL